MAIRSVCPNCQATAEVPENFVGKKVQCLNCNKIYHVPAPASQVVPVAEVAVEPAPAPRRDSSSHRRRIPPRRPAPRKEKKSSGILILTIAIASFVVLVLAGTIALAWYVMQNNNKPVAHTPPPPFPSSPSPSRSDRDIIEEMMRDREGDGGSDEEKGKMATYEAKDLAKWDAAQVDFHFRMPLLPTNSVAPRPPAADGSLAADVLKKVKVSTPRLHVVGANGDEGEGSGFFVAPGIIVTNRHVVSMMNANPTKPRSVQVVLDGGEATERSVKGQVIGWDPIQDLAIVKVEGSNLPEPLVIASSQTVSETQRVYTVGYPFGSHHSKNVNVATTSVSNLVKDKGEVKFLVVNGGMNPGNSGGPLVDTSGQVVGVAVSVVTDGRWTNTGINNAIPSDYVLRLLAGSIERLAFDYPELKDGKLAIPFTLKLTDPMKRIGNLDVEWWFGDKGDERKPSLTAPKEMPGDSPRTKQAIALSDGKAKGTLSVSPPPEGKWLWLQFSTGADAKDQRWSSTIAYQPPPPLVRKSVDIKLQKPGSKQSTFKLAWKMDLSYPSREADYTIDLFAKVDEKRTSQNVKRDYREFDMGVRYGNDPAPIRVIPGIIKDWVGHFEEETDTSVNSVPQEMRRSAKLMSPWVNKLTECLLVPYTENSGSPWTASTEFPIGNVSATSKAEKKLSLSYTPIGVRKVNGREEAALLVEASSSDGKDKFKGMAWVDMATGQVVTVRANFEYAFSTERSQGHGHMEMRLERELASTDAGS
jgi:S1-C subfamily serine protease